jgi:hypothetical protein
MLEKLRKFFFSPEPEVKKSNNLVEDVSLYLPSNYKVKGPCPRTMALCKLLFNIGNGFVHH